MNSKHLIWVMATIGSIAGGYLPSLFGSSDLSGWGILWGTVGGIAGAILGYRMSV